MATVVPPRQPMFSVGMNIDLSRNKQQKLYEEWYREAMRMIREREKTEERGYLDRLMGQETNYRTVPGGIMPMADETGAFVETMMPERREAYQTPVYERTKLDTPESINRYRDEMRAKLQALGVKLLGERPDPYTLMPRYGESVKKTAPRTYAPKAPKLWFDDKDNTYNSNTAEGLAGIAYSNKMGWNPRRPANEFEAKMAQSQYNRQQFLMSEEDETAYKEKIRGSIFTQDELKNQTVTKVVNELSGYSLKDNEANKIIRNAERQINKLRVKNWNKPTPQEQKNIDTIKATADTKLMRLYEAKVARLPKAKKGWFGRKPKPTEDEVRAYMEVFATDKKILEELKKAGYDVEEELKKVGYDVE